MEDWKHNQQKKYLKAIHNQEIVIVSILLVEVFLTLILLAK